MKRRGATLKDGSMAVRLSQRGAGSSKGLASRSAKGRTARYGSLRSDPGRLERMHCRVCSKRTVHLIMSYSCECKRCLSISRVDPDAPLQREN